MKILGKFIYLISFKPRLNIRVFTPPPNPLKEGDLARFPLFEGVPFMSLCKNINSLTKKCKNPPLASEFPTL